MDKGWVTGIGVSHGTGEASGIESLLGTAIVMVNVLASVPGVCVPDDP